MEQLTFAYGDHKYRYYRVYEDRKTISLTVQPSLNIILRCPNAYTEEKIEKFLKRKWHWLEKQLKDLRRFQSKKAEKEYISGEAFLYLGRQYKLVVKESDKNRVYFEAGKIVIEAITPNKKLNKKLLEDWYEERANKVFRERYRQVLKKFNYNFIPDLALRKMEKRWGSFLTKKKVLLNPELIKASKECIDYVITHELCHMKYQNHSSDFYKLLGSKIPHWKKVKEKLELRFL